MVQKKNKINEFQLWGNLATDFFFFIEAQFTMDLIHSKGSSSLKLRKPKFKGLASKSNILRLQKLDNISQEIFFWVVFRIPIFSLGSSRLFY